MIVLIKFSNIYIAAKRRLPAISACLVALLLITLPSCKEAARVFSSDVISSVTSNPPGYFFPEATAIIPAGGAIPVNTSAVITFNLPINLPNPCNSITITSNLPVPATLAEGADYTLALGGGSKVVTITFSGAFNPIPNGATITITVIPNIVAASGGITDDPNGITVQSTLSGSFTVGTAWDSTAPDIVPGTNYPTTPPVTVYLTDATRMAQATPQEIHVQFNENIDPTSITTSTVYLTQPGPVNVPATISYIAATRYAILTPAVNLDPSTTYTVHLREDIRDLAGNTLGPGTGDFTTWTFATTASLAELDITPGVAPVLSDLHVDSVGTADGTISWITNEPSYHTLHYGRNSAAGSAVGPSVTASTFETEALLALSTNARYWFNIDFTDIEGLAGTNTGNYQFNTESSDGADYIDMAAGNQNNPRTIPYHPTGGGATGCYLFWNDSDVPTTYTHIYGQLYDSTFTLPALWGAARKGIFTEPGEAYTYASAAEDGAGGVIVLAQRTNGGHIYAKRIATGGGFYWGHTAAGTGLDVRSAPTAALSSMSAVPVSGTLQTIRAWGTMTRDIPANPVYDFTATIDFMTPIQSGADFILGTTGPNNGTTVIESSNFRHVIGQNTLRVSAGQQYMIADASVATASENAQDHDGDFTYPPYTYTSGGTHAYSTHSFSLPAWLGNLDSIRKDGTWDFGYLSGAPVARNFGWLVPCYPHGVFEYSDFYDFTVNWSINITSADTFTVYNLLASGTAEAPPAHPLYDDNADYLVVPAVADGDIVVNLTNTTGPPDPYLAVVDASTFAVRTRALDMDADIMVNDDEYAIIRLTYPGSGTTNIIDTGIAGASAAAHLQDPANSFAAVQPGDVVYNLMNGLYAVVTARAANDLTLSRDISFALWDHYVVIRQRGVLFTWEENGSVWGRITGVDNGASPGPEPDAVRAPWAIDTGTHPHLVPDGNGNAILVYEFSAWSINAVLLDGFGTILNTVDIDTASGGLDETIIDVKSDDAGGVVILYKLSDGTLRAQRIDGPTWTRQWSDGGYTLHDATVTTVDEVMAYDPLVPNDISVAATVISAGNYDIWARRMGTTSWGPFNYTGTSAARQEKPQIYLGATTTIILWDDYRFFNQSYINTGYGIFGLKVNTATGTAASAAAPLWRANSGGTDDFNGVSVIMNHFNEYPGIPLVVPYNNGADSVLVWADYREGPGADLKYIDLDAFVPAP